VSALRTHHIEVEGTLPGVRQALYGVVLDFKEMNRGLMQISQNHFRQETENEKH
jgi:hypothetical protein